MILSEARREGPFDLIVDALGTYSPLIGHAAAPDTRAPLHYGAIWASLPWPGAPFDPHALEQRYEQASMMAGVLPIGAIREGEPQQAAFFWSLKTEDFPAWKAEGLEIWKARVLALWPQTEPLLNAVSTADQMVLARYDHHTLLLPYGRNLVFIGDSAHSTSPQLGQGANMALLDVMALAASLKENKNIQAAIEAYAKKRRFHVKLYQAMSRVFTPFYQSDSTLLPLLRDHIVAPLSRFPLAQRVLALMVCGMLGLPESALPSGKMVQQAP